MVQLQASLADLRKSANFVIISQDPPDKNKGVVAKTNLEIPIYADTSLKAAEQFGIVFRIDEKTAKAFKGFGLDLEALYGRAQPLMPVPAVFVIDSSGRIAFQYVNPDYRNRLAPEVLRAVLQFGL